jgi:hypothetical protein
MSGWRREGCRIAVSPDLNRPFPASADILATMANNINERGQISGMATVLSGPDADLLRNGTRGAEHVCRWAISTDSHIALTQRVRS